MSLYNGAEQLSAIVGSRLYEQYFDQQLGPLLWVASGSFLLCLLMLPLLRRLDKVAEDDVAYEDVDAR